MKVFAATWTELGIGSERRFAFGAGGANVPAPVFGSQLFIFFGHSGMGPDLFDRLACLGGGHFDPQIGGALFTEPFFLVPARFAADPGGTTGTLDKAWFDLVDRLGEGAVMRLFPGGGADLFADRRGPVEDTAKDTAGRLQRAGDVPGGPAFKVGPVAGAAAVAGKFKLESPVGAGILIIFNEFNNIAHTNNYSMIDRKTERLTKGWAIAYNVHMHNMVNQAACLL